ncbi:hypothetical protein [Microtetraspora glauca]|uniref:DUF3558 domain-containing protein n=1 Tax=Microtetraspora glauca TaxID=1996 RepID=A0ABV3GTH9_MICGL
MDSQEHGPTHPTAAGGPGHMTAGPTAPMGHPQQIRQHTLVRPISRDTRRRRGWVVPVVATVTALTATGAVAAFVVLRSEEGPGRGADKRAAGAASPARTSVAPPDACAMPKQATVERLVPQATATRDTWDRQDASGYITWICTLRNDNFSFGEYIRSRSIEVKLTRYDADGELTALRVARNFYDAELTSGKYAETHSTRENYSSKVRTLPGVGEEAFARYTWARDAKSNKYSFGQGIGRVGNIVIQVKYQAGQQRKDAPILSMEGAQGVTEENALREVSGILGEVAVSVAAWRDAGGATAPVDSTASSAAPTPAASPSAAPSASPSAIALPAECSTASPVALRYAPDATPKATQTQDGASTTVECAWLNRDLAAGAKARMRGMFVTVQRFTNRVGAEDPKGAKNQFVDQRAKGRKWAGSGITDSLFWYRSTDVTGLGDAAFRQYRTNRTPTVHAGIGQVTALYGPVVVTVEFYGADRPKGAPLNSRKSRLMGGKESLAGAMAVARAMSEALATE